jgi:hypothetical protein
VASTTLTSANGQTLNETLKLLSEDGASNDEFGRSVAISGTTAIVGAWWDDDNAPNSGSAYLFDTATGVQLAKLLPSDGTRGDQFGISVGISGTTAIIGAYQDDDNGLQSGSAYLFDATTGAQIAKLLPNDGAAGDFFGYHVSISGNTAIVGAPNNSGSGSAYLFDATTGAQIAKLLPNDGAAGDFFGYHVSISGNTAIVGAPNNSGSGSAYLFDATTGAQIAKLLPSDGALNDKFASAVGISGSTAIVGSVFDDDNGSESGSAYLFDTTTGVEIAKLLPSDGAVEDQFGIMVAIDGTTAVIGAFHHDDNGPNSGSAYLFDTLNAIQIAKLLPSNGLAADRFGRSVAISGSTAIVGANKYDGSGADTGCAYLFNTTTGTQIAELISSDSAAEDRFGRAVAISGANAIVGAYQDDDNGADSGSAYLFDIPSPLNAAYCFGDGTGTPCPCGNTGGPGEGCANDTGAGAVLSIQGSNSVSNDDLVLSTTGLPLGPGLYFQGENAINSGNGNPFGDGLRCAGMDVTRLQVRFSSGGAAQTSISIVTKGDVSAGDTKRYQHWYRDTGTSPCGNLFNLTNGYEVTWTI